MHSFTVAITNGNFMFRLQISNIITLQPKYLAAV